MLFIPSKQLLYLNAPKTGSVTVYTAILDFCAAQEISVVTHDQFGLLEHDNRAAIEAALVAADYSIDDILFFTTIRNPWLRCRSLFKFGRLDKCGREWWSNEYDNSAGYLSPREWVFGDQEEFLSFRRWSAFYELENYAHVGKAQNAAVVFRIEDQLTELAETIDVRLPGFRDFWEARSSAHLNVGDTIYETTKGEKPFLKMEFEFDEKIIAAIADAWQRDIALGGYKPPAVNVGITPSQNTEESETPSKGKTGRFLRRFALSLLGSKS